jgi:hypothetical protein
MFLLNFLLENCAGLLYYRNCRSILLHDSCNRIIEMIESVSTSPVQSPALRSSPQSTNAAPAAAVANPSNFISSRVRVDNLVNVAILEYRNSDGAVVRQYPTPAQIQAFKRAEHLAREHVQDVKLEQPVHTQAPSSNAAPSAPASAPAAADNATPTTADVIAAAASYSPPAAPGGNSTQSTTA